MDAVEAYLQQYQPGPQPRLFQTTRLYDRRGALLAELWDEGRRTWTPLVQISQHLIDATIAAEDASFYVNAGIDPARIAGAALQNVQQGEIVSGASTITMQLARNLFLGPEQRYDQNFDRKLLEAGLAQELATLFSKDEVLEMYLNLLNYGHLAYGPEAAAQVYFAKPASDLNLAESALLAGIPQQPANLDPTRNFQAAKARQRVVLDLMVRHGYLAPAQADAAFAQPLDLNPQPDLPATAWQQTAPHFVQTVEQAFDEQLGRGKLRRSGWEVITTLDLDMQQLAQAAVSENVAQLQPLHDLGNAALVALRPGSNEIIALIGSADFNDPAIDGQVNVALSPRQPGSAIKPILYATAFNDNLISPASVIWDSPITYTIGADSIYEPANYDRRFHGPVTVRSALANSYNVPAVKLLDALGVERMLLGAQALGVSSLSQSSQWYGLSLTLGGGELTLLELTTAYATLANQGRYVEPRLVLRTSDSLGREVGTTLIAPAQPVQAIYPSAAFLVSDILADNAARQPAFGPNNPLQLSRPAAVKTGTTSDWRDNWTVGYTRYLVAGVWAGNSDGHPMRNSSGLTGAAPIWRDFMEAVLAHPTLLALLEASDNPADWQFSPPAGVQRRPDCPPGLGCPENGEYFSSAWLEAAGEAGPLADSVHPVPAAPVYVDRGEGPQWAGYCQVEPAATRTLLRLPGSFGLSGKSSEAAGSRPDPLPAPVAAPETLQAIAWTLRNSAPVDLGPCDSLAETAGRALALAPKAGDENLRLLVDLQAALDPEAGPVGGETATPLAPLSPAAASPGLYSLAQPVSHHSACPGHYIIGQVLNRADQPVAGVHISLVDQWGNRADAVSKSGAADYGNYDFPLNHFANRYTLTITDEAGNPLSAPVIVDHLQGDSGDAPCHTVVWTGG